ncbi:MAG: putative repeat protein (TIGR01451 family) [Kiritimatiellia bacterium]
MVDLFTQNQIMNGPSIQPTVNSFGGSILGNQRDAADESESAIAEVIGGELVITGAPTAIIFLDLQWDGFDSDNIVLNQEGLAGFGQPVDFTDGGENSMLEFGFTELTLGASPINVQAAAFSGMGNISVAVMDLTENISSPNSVILPFSAFGLINGSGADFSEITALQIIFLVEDNQEQGPPQLPDVASGITFALDFIQAARGPNADLSVTKTDTLATDLNGDGIANPGETIRYTIVITNAGPDSVTAASLADLLPPGTTLVPGSVKSSPIARDDFFATPPSTSLTISAPGVLRNDNDPDGEALVIDSFDPVTALGVPMTLNPDGGFVYMPNATTGTDTFSYAISDGVFTNDALVSIAIDPVAELSVSLTDDVDPITAGGSLTFTSVVTNSGPSEAVDVRITHRFPPGISFLMASPGPGISCSNPSTGLVVCDIASLPIGGTATISLATTASGSGTLTSQVSVTSSVLDNNPSDDVALESTFINSPPVAPDLVQVPAIGNTSLSVAAPGVLAGAFDPEGQPLTVVTTATNSLNGGTVTLQPDGAYTYLPAAGFAGPSDTFNFVISDGTGTDTGSVGLSISNMIWYVDNSLALNGDGTSENPFNTLVALSPSGSGSLSGPDGPGDTIFLYEGSGPYVADLLLADQQRLIGEGVGLTIGGSSLVPAGNRPVVVATIVLAADNVISGLDFGSGPAPGFAVSGGTGTLVIDEASVSGEGRLDLGAAPGVDVTIVLDQLLSTNGGFSLSEASGSFVVSGGTHISTPQGNPGIQIINSSVISSFGDTLIEAGMEPGIRLESSPSATTTFSSLNIAESSSGFSAINAGTVNILAQPVTITASSGPAVVIDTTAGQNNGSSGWIFDTLLSADSSGSGIQLSNLTDDVTVSGETVIGLPAGDGVLIAGSAGRTFSFAGLTISGGSARGLVVGTSAAANLSVNGLVVNAVESAVKLDGLNIVQIVNPGFINFLQSTDGTVVDLANITSSSINFGDVFARNSAGPGVLMNAVGGVTTFGFVESFTTGGDGMNLQNAGRVNVNDAFSFIEATGGTALVLNGVDAGMDLGFVAASGGATGVSITSVTGSINIFEETMITATTGTGVSITNSPAGTFSFGNIAIDTSANNQPGLEVTNGGSLGNNLTGTSTIDSGSAGAVNIDATELALVFSSVSSSGGTDPGIRLNDTTGFFTIQGDGVNASQGGNGSGGQIIGKSGDAVVLTDVENITLRRMQLDNNGRAIQMTRADTTLLEFCSLDNSSSHGIDGSEVVDLTITSCAFDGNGSAASDATIRFVGTDPLAGISGSFQMSRSLIRNYPTHAVQVLNHSGVLAASIDQCTINNNNDVFGSHALSFESVAAAQIALDVLNSTFDQAEGAIVQFLSDASSGNDLNIIGNTSTNGGGPDGSSLGGSISLELSNGGSFAFDIQENTLTALPDVGIRIFGEGSAEGRIGGQDLASGNILQVLNGPGSSAAEVIALTKGGSVATPAVGGHAWSVLVQNNVLGSPAGFPAGSGTSEGIVVRHAHDNGMMNLTLEDNQLENIAQKYIRILTEGVSAPVSNLRIVNNVFANLVADALQVDTADAAATCLHLQGNASGSGGNPGVFGLNQNGASTLQVASTSIPALSAGNNNATILDSGTITFNGNCSNPTQPTNP